MTHYHPHASPALHGSTTIVTLRCRILLRSSKSFLYQCLLHRSGLKSNNLLISSWDSSIRLVDVESSKLRLEVQTEAAVLDCCFQNEFVAFSAASDGSIFRYFQHASGEIFAISQELAQFVSINRSILPTFAHDDINAGSWFIGLDVKHIDEAKLCCSSWSSAGWPGLALAHGCCWFPAATGFGFSVELGMIQGVSAVGAFYELLSQSSLNVSRHGERKPVTPVELCPILKTLYKILIKREQSSEDILQALRDENMNDPRDRIEIAQSHAFYMPSLR